MTAHRFDKVPPLFAKPKFDGLVDGLRRVGDESIRPADPNVDPCDRPRLTGQNALVLERLRKGPLTVTEAWDQMGIRRLGARIYDLHKAGYLTLTTRLDNNDTLYTLLDGKTEPDKT